MQSVLQGLSLLSAGIYTSILLCRPLWLNVKWLWGYKFIRHSSSMCAGISLGGSLSTEQWSGNYLCKKKKKKKSISQHKEYQGCGITQKRHYTESAWKKTEMSLYMLQASSERISGPSGVNWAKLYASAASKQNSEWMWTLGRKWC